MEQVSEKLSEFLSKIPKAYYLPICLTVAGVIFLGIGLTQLLSSQQKPLSDNVSAQDAVPSSGSAQMQIGSMQVDIEGAVLKPGVYQLSFNARVQDGLIAAGGLAQNADREAVARSLNLAAKLSDGAKVYIPKIGEVSSAANSSGASSVSVLGAQTNLVNINTASESDLDNLPGIGPATAQKIISARPFSSVDDLLAKKVVSQSVFTKIKDMVTIY